MPYAETNVDNRYKYSGEVSYTIGADEVVGTYTTTDKDHASLKLEMLGRAKTMASTLLTRDQIGRICNYFIEIYNKKN